MYCKNCGKPMNENQAVCLECGVQKGAGNAFCHNCGSSVTPNADYCMSCGVSLRKCFGSGMAGKSINGQDKLVLILVCLFLGEFGIHNFILGETKKGIFRIIMSLCCGIGYILALIDLVKIALDTYEVNPDKLI